MIHKPFLKIITGQHLTCYFGGGGGKTPPKLAAPVTQSQAEVSIAGRQRRKQLGRRQGLASTILAGGNPGLTSGKSKLSGES